MKLSEAGKNIGTGTISWLEPTTNPEATMSFIEHLKMDVANAREMIDKTQELVEHGAVCMAKATEEFDTLTVRRRSRGRTLFGKGTWAWPAVRVVEIRRSPTLGNARVISYSHRADGEVCNIVDCIDEQGVECQIRKAIVNFLV